MLWNSGLTSREIAREMGLHERVVASAVQMARASGEVVEERRHSGAGRLRNAVWAMHCSGMAPSEIDAELGTDHAREIVARLWAMDWEAPSWRG